MWDGSSDIAPIQGAVVAAVFLVISVIKIMRGVSGSEAILWNAIGFFTFFYLFIGAAWIVTNL